jgi:hypothetical protein
MPVDGAACSHCNARAAAIRENPFKRFPDGIDHDSPGFYPQSAILPFWAANRLSVSYCSMSRLFDLLPPRKRDSRSRFSNKGKAH